VKPSRRDVAERAARFEVEAGRCVSGGVYLIPPLARRATLFFGLALLFSLSLRAADPAPAPPPLDILLRLKGTNLATSPAVKAAVDRALQAYRGQPQFLELVRAFDLTDQTSGLIDLAVAHPDDSTGAEALQRVIDDGHLFTLEEILGGPTLITPRGTALVRALGNVANAAVPEMLQGVVMWDKLPEEVRLNAVRSLIRSEAGSQALLAMARSGNFPEALKSAAGTALAGSPWTDLKDEAARLLPPASPAGQSIPPLATVLALRGDAARGEKIFFGAAACGTCHQLGGKGVDFGPGLSEIGDKYGPDALYANIVDPAAGIAFGYEPWQITLRNGAAIGFIASETDDELTVKAPGNIITRYRKSDVTARERLPGSLMPPGLLAATNAQEAADLLAFLGSLKKGR
jgi:putative heme-binding domain-containing protein